MALFSFSICSQILQLAETPSPFSVAVFNDRVFWSDTKRRSIRSADKKTGKKQNVLLKRLGQPFGLKVTLHFFSLCATCDITRRWSLVELKTDSPPHPAPSWRVNALSPVCRYLLPPLQLELHNGVHLMYIACIPLLLHKYSALYYLFFN